MTRGGQASRELHRRTREVFLAVRELGDADRVRRLAEISAEEPEVAREVRELLAQLRDEDSFLARPLAVRGTTGDADASTPRAPDPPPVERIGGYRVLAPLGRGGMGVVYLAEQEVPHRRVALKLLRREAASPDLVRRFRREIEVLGKIEHPGVARIFEAGVERMDGAELPWFAMELVEGRPLTEHARRERLDARARVELVAAVCDAVEAAHAAGVVHRDLKPDNVLVEASGRVRVLDFGVAAVVGAALDPATLHTATGELIGTVSYMSPEQASGARERVDARSDVYSLGVMLHELLVGSLPYSTRDVMLHEAVRAIREEEPTSLHRARPDLGRELAAVVGKALEKEPARRYASAAEFAADLRRWLADEPVHARPPSTAYKLAKLASRHRALFGAIAVAIVALATALTVAVVALQRVRESSRRATAEHEATQRLSDLRGIELLEREADQLWPAVPERQADLDRWLDDAGAIVARTALHADALAAMRATPGAFRAEDVAVAGTLVERLDAFAEPERGAYERIRERAEFARSLRARTVDDHADAWRAAVDWVASSPKYAGVSLQPQVGLVPLGPDPRSGLAEFALYGATGRTPRRDAATGELDFDDSCALVLVLLPGGTFRQGLPLAATERDRLDPHSLGHERGERDVTLDPFFISKYEVTQEQWQRMTGRNPSYFERGSVYFEVPTGPNHPVEFVSWNEAVFELARFELELPTEAQWECAARCGTRTAWWWGTDEFARGKGNFSGYVRKGPGEPRAGLEDIWYHHAPVGSFEPSPFGLFDVYGNVYEWCRDPYKVAYFELPGRPGDGLVLAESEGDKTLRGGSWDEPVTKCRSSHRTDGLAELRRNNLGVRPVKRVE